MNEQSDRMPTEYEWELIRSFFNELKTISQKYETFYRPERSAPWTEGAVDTNGFRSGALLVLFDDDQVRVYVISPSYGKVSAGYHGGLYVRSGNKDGQILNVTNETTGPWWDALRKKIPEFLSMERQFIAKCDAERAVRVSRHQAEEKAANAKRRAELQRAANEFEGSGCLPMVLLFVGWGTLGLLFRVLRL
jgi:hypothetical protein